MNITMLPKEIVNSLSKARYGNYYFCSYQYKGVKVYRRVSTDLNARQTRKVMIVV